MQGRTYDSNDDCVHHHQYKTHKVADLWDGRKIVAVTMDHGDAGAWSTKICSRPGCRRNPAIPWSPVYSLHMSVSSGCLCKSADQAHHHKHLGLHSVNASWWSSSPDLHWQAWIAHLDVPSCICRPRVQCCQRLSMHGHTCFQGNSRKFKETPQIQFWRQSVGVIITKLLMPH